jgi:hypothetical protein
MSRRIRFMSAQTIRIIKTSAVALLLLPFLLGMGRTPKINMNLDYRPVGAVVTT